MPEWLNMSVAPSEVSPTSQFRSRTPRRTGLVKEDAGDPGAYDAKESLAQRSYRSYNRNVTAGDASFLRREKRSGSAPPRTRVGPADYSFGHLYETGSDASIRVRSSFQSELPLGGHVRKSTTPGVGSYETGVGAMGKAMDSPSRSVSKEGHSMFASATPRKELADLHRTDPSVAPGSYNRGGSMQERCEATKNPRLPGFLSSSPRVAGGGGGGGSARGRSRSPAPGDYDDFANRTLSARSSRSFSNLMAKGEGNFLCSSKQLGSIINKDAGDPGAYVGPHSPGVHRGNKESLGAKSTRSFSRDVGAGDARFNTRSPARSQTPPRTAARVGPADYSFGHLYETGSDASIRVRSSFQSELPLGGHVRKSTTPGVGSYETGVGAMGKAMDSPSRSVSKEGHSMFASATPRKELADLHRTDPSVGPASYDLSRFSMGGKLKATANPRLPGFKSSAPRFDYDEYDD